MCILWMEVHSMMVSLHHMPLIARKTTDRITYDHPFVNSQYGMYRI